MQRRATKSVKELKNKPSSETLALLHTSSLVKRRLRGDLIQAYRIIKELIRWISCTSSSWMMVVGYLRGHNLKVKVQRSRLQLRQKFFSQRVVCAWNSLPYSVVEASPVNIFWRRDWTIGVKMWIFKASASHPLHVQVTSYSNCRLIAHFHQSLA